MLIHQERKLFLGFKSTILLFFLSVSTSFGQSTWKLVNPLPTRNSLGSVTYGNGKFVVVGYYDTVLTSPDGKTWSKINLPSFQTLKSVVYGDSLSAGKEGLFLASGDPFTFITSPDGITWTTTDLPIMPDFSSVTYGNGRFMAIEIGYPTFWICTDGKTWTEKNPNLNNIIFSYVTYCNNQFVALDHSIGTMKNPNDFPQPDTNKILTSADGSSWTMQNIFPVNCTSNMPPGLNFITYGSNLSNGQDGQFVAFGYHDTVLTSPDGIVWTAIKSITTNYIRSVIFANGQFLAVGDTGKILTSPDGTTWTQQNSGTVSTLFSITYAHGLFVAVGDNGTILTSKADPVGVAFQTNAKSNISSLKINIAKNCISAKLPNAITHSQFKVGLFNVSGKQIYSTTTGTQNGILNIPTKGFPAGKYFMSITDENNRILNSSFVLTR